MPEIPLYGPVLDDDDPFDASRKGLGYPGPVSRSSARAPEEDGDVDEDHVDEVPDEDFDGELALVDLPGDDEGPVGAVLEFSTIYDRLGRNPKDKDALEAVRQWVIRWARRHGFAEEADDIAQDVVDKLVTPRGAIDAALGRAPIGFDLARGRATFRGYVFGLYLNARRPEMRYRQRRRLQSDVNVLDQIHRSDRGAVGGTSSLVDNVPGELSDRIEEALGALEAANPRGYRAVVLRFVRDQEYVEIAASLRTSEVNARKVVSLAIRFLKQYLGGTAQ